MDRVQNYNLQTPLTADDLNKERDYTAIALGKIVSALLGQGTVVSDLAATAVASTTVPTVQLSDGQLYELATLDPTAFGSLPVKSFPSIATVMKQGLLLASRGDTNTFELTPPGTSGESIIYLLEAQYADLDTDTQTITFYNVSDPTNPTTATQPRVREGTISFVLKAGIASSSPTAPSADAGYVPLYTIEVAYGQTVLSQSDITVASGAPFLSQKLFGLMNLSGTVDVPALTASGLITANDGIDVAGGTLTIPNATANNEPPALSQLFIGNRKAVFTSSGTWTVPDFVDTIWVSGCAGGGGGGGGGGTVGSSGDVGGGGGGGGGAGQSTLKQAISVTGGHVLSVSIGAGGGGGAGGSSSGSSGSNGGSGGNTVLTDSTSSTTLLTLSGAGSSGGGGGQTSTSAGLGSGGPGGNAGTGYPAGQYGSDGNYTGNGGSGASGPFGGGGGAGRAGTGGAYPGASASGFGAGGGGGGGVYGGSAAAGDNGGNGAPGFLVIEW